eukprot:scaffold15236_cov75-Cyclotella_meneghiniana.AAC.7
MKLLQTGILHSDGEWVQGRSKLEIPRGKGRKSLMEVWQSLFDSSKARIERFQWTVQTIFLCTNLGMFRKYLKLKVFNRRVTSTVYCSMDGRHALELNFKFSLLKRSCD